MFLHFLVYTIFYLRTVSSTILNFRKRLRSFQMIFNILNVFSAVSLTV